MILETIAEATRKRVAAEKEKCSLAEMKEKATAMNPDTGFIEGHHRRRFPLSGDRKGI